MEHLSKQQVTLLCLLVALFTSITTSVITASLMDKSADGVSSTIYRVVEKTIEQVAPKDSTVAKKIAEKEKEKESPKSTPQEPLDQIVEAAAPTLVSIYSQSGTENGTFVSSGVIAGEKNSVIAFSGQNIFDNVNYWVKLQNGKQFEMVKKSVNLSAGMVLLSYADTAKEKDNLKGLTLGSLSNEKLGSNIIAFGIKGGGNVVSTGIISEFPLDDGTTPNKSIAVTDIKLSSPATGWLLLDTSGDLIGFGIAINEGDKGARYMDAGTFKVAAPDYF